VSGLLGMLSSTARALDAQRFGLDVVGQNIANVNTPGYAKRVAQFQELALADRLRAGNGVDVIGVRTMRDRLIDRRLREELQSEQRYAAMASMLSIVEVALGRPGGSIDKSLSDFFDAFAALAESPLSSTARQQVVLTGQSVASAFREMAERFEAALRDADARVRGTVDAVNDLAARVASLNASLAGTPPASSEGLHLRDQVDRAVTSLAALIDISAIERADGGFDLSFGGGRMLVTGSHFYAMRVIDRAVTGAAEITSGGAVVTGETTGGRLGGLLHVRDTHLPAYMADLDALAYAVTQHVNAAHQAGFDLAGTAGGAFFAPPGSVTGAARTMAASPLLTAPGGEALVAASADPASAGHNANARALAALRDARLLAGGTATFHDLWARMVYTVGRDTAAARDEQRSRAEIVRQVENLQDSVSGVSLDEEAADMLRFQRAYEANARFFRAIDEALETLLRMVGR
jgi:flagellar hook-associated protein 1